MNDKVFESTANETVAYAFIWFIIAVLLQVFGRYDTSTFLFSVFIFGLIVSFAMGIKKNYAYLGGLVIGGFVLAIIYFSLDKDVLIHGVSFKEAVNPVPVITQILVWVFGWLLSIKK